MDSKIIVLGAAVFLAVIAISLLAIGPSGKTTADTTTTTIQDSAQQEPSESEAVSSLDSQWSDEADTVEIGEMI